ncbi:MAG: cation diffusion facilitator family transporter [Rhodobacteraceae bacterium]|nr:cation diffusion facilitator family transporter [Paracoccaceae bacterium]
MPHDHHLHHHDHPPHGPSEAAGDRRVAAAILLNFCLSLAQVAGGIASGSIALIADALHNLSDVLALVLAFAARRIARRPATPGMSFGYARAEVVAALINYTTLVLVSIWLSVEALIRIADPPEVTGWIVVVLALVAFSVNGATTLLTWRMASDSVNIRAAFLHNMTDAATSLAVALGGALILLFGWRLVDPLLTLGISAWILIHSLTEIRPVIRILMLGTPEGADVAGLRARIEAVAGVDEAHHLHWWQIDERRSSVEVHLVLADGADAATVTASVRDILARDFGIVHATLETEDVGTSCVRREC